MLGLLPEFFLIFVDKSVNCVDKSGDNPDFTLWGIGLAGVKRVFTGDRQGKKDFPLNAILVRFSGMGFYTGFSLGTDCAMRAQAHRALFRWGKPYYQAFREKTDNPRMGDFPEPKLAGTNLKELKHENLYTTEWRDHDADRRHRACSDHLALGASLGKLPRKVEQSAHSNDGRIHTRCRVD